MTAELIIVGLIGPVGRCPPLECLLRPAGTLGSDCAVASNAAKSVAFAGAPVSALTGGPKSNGAGASAGGSSKAANGAASAPPAGRGGKKAKPGSPSVETFD